MDLQKHQPFKAPQIILNVIRNWLNGLGGYPEIVA
jgi:hypothetical protein